jgi:gamma-glutamylcyclotransferase (GGCT)/AIG2-like uncharacterized protein YtfP
MNLFAYGTLMWPEIMSDVIDRKVEGRPARLSDARRLRVKDQVYPSLVPAEGFEVEGIVYSDLSEAEVAALDHFEGEEYVRRSVEVRCGDQMVTTDVYFTSEAGMALHEPDEWTPEHLSDSGVQNFRETYKGWD